MGLAQSNAGVNVERIEQDGCASPCLRHLPGCRVSKRVLQALYQGLERKRRVVRRAASIGLDPSYRYAFTDFRTQTESGYFRVTGGRGINREKRMLSGWRDGVAQSLA